MDEHSAILELCSLGTVTLSLLVQGPVTYLKVSHTVQYVKKYGIIESMPGYKYSIVPFWSQRRFW